MLVELRVTNLGVIEELCFLPGEAMTAVTGETGAGKTMVVGAIGLLAGGRADSSMVRPGAAEAVIDGRFLIKGEEIILTRVVPADGRSRAYRNGRPISAAELAEIGSSLMEIHGQHAHQELLSPLAQRRALDSFAGTDLTDLEEAIAQVRRLEAERGSLGGDERARLRELDVLRFQLDELDEATIDDPDEDAKLQTLEARLSSAEELQAGVTGAQNVLSGDGGVRDQLASATAKLDAVATDPDLAVLLERLKSVTAEVTDIAGELRRLEGRFVADPAALTRVQQRRRVLTALRRKYGGTLEEVIAERDRIRASINQIQGAEERITAIETELVSARERWASAAAHVAEARRTAAPVLARAIEGHLSLLGMPQVRFSVDVGTSQGDAPDAGDLVVFQIATNPGVPLGPLSKVASGGELSRTMLALRLVLSGGPPVAVFDEVDAGIGGEAALMVAQALGGVAEERQVLVVTHLAQVAARASHHAQLSKTVDGGTTRTSISVLDQRSAREQEIARMLSGSPESETARQHAAELLDRSW